MIALYLLSIAVAGVVGRPRAEDLTP